MAYLIRGTTPTITVTSEDIDFSDYKCFLSGGRRASGEVLYDAFFTVDDTAMTKTESGGSYILGCTLTQENTLAMRPGDGILQLRAIDAGGTAIACYAVPVIVADVAQRGEISYV